MLPSDARTRFAALWRGARIGTLRRELAALAHRTPAAAQDAADAPFFRGERAAAFHAYLRPEFVTATTATIGGWWEPAAQDLRRLTVSDRDRITADVLIGDTQANCGRFTDARRAWMQSLQDGPRGTPRNVYYPERTSALRRLVHFRDARDRSLDDVFCATTAMAQAHQRAYQIEVRAAEAQLASAWRLLSDGQARHAARMFANAMPYWEKHVAAAGTGWADAQRGLVIASVYARDDAAAARGLNGIVARQHEPAGDALVFAGRWNDALAAYVDETAQEPSADSADPVAARGAAVARSGDLRGAIAVWSAGSSASGPANVTDEITALIGIARARLGDWSGAERSWLDATRIGRAVPEWQGLWNGNVTALAMLYHYRAHFRRGDHAYRLPIDPGPRS